MKDRYLIILFCTAIALVTSISYRFSRPQWVSYHRAQILYAQKDYDAAVTEYQTALDKGLNDSGMLLKLVDAQLILKRYDDARTTMRRIKSSMSLKPDPAYQLSEAFVGHGRFDEAAELLEHAALMYPDNRRILFRHAQILSWMQKYEKAVAGFYSALNSPQEVQDAADWQIRWELARVLSYSKKYNEAIEQYQKTVSLKPDLLRARVEMAEVLFWSGRNDEAIRMLDTITYESLSAETKRTAAEIYAAKGDYDAAEKIYRNCLSSDPNDDVSRFRLAEVLSWHRKYDESIDEYEKIMDMRPDDDQLRRKYAVVLSWAGRYEEASVQMRRALHEEVK